MQRPTRKVSGFTLIEAMVSLLVLSIGLAGIAALHLTSLANAHSSYFRSVASTIALDLEERIWDHAANSFSVPGACITDTDLAEVRTGLLAQWGLERGANQAGLIGVPGLGVQFGARQVRVETREQPGVDGEWQDRWIQIPVRLTWAETRFRNDDANVEQFDYVVRMPCVPEFVPTS